MANVSDSDLDIVFDFFNQANSEFNPSEDEVKAVIFAWTNGIVRTSRSILILTRQGFHIECAPLFRYLVEHIVMTIWLLTNSQELLSTLKKKHSVFLTTSAEVLVKLGSYEKYKDQIEASMSLIKDFETEI